MIDCVLSFFPSLARVNNVVVGFGTKTEAEYTIHKHVHHEALRYSLVLTMQQHAIT